MRTSKVVTDRQKALRDLVDSHMLKTHDKLMNKPSNLAKSLRVLWLDCNQIEELPESFQNFKYLNVIHIENNPMKSPPAEISVLGTAALSKYCAVRVNRIRNVVEKLRRVNIDFSRDHLTPNAKNFLHEKSKKYLLVHKKNENQ